MTIHLITTCSKSKTIPPSVTFPYGVTPLEEAYLWWIKKLQKQKISEPYSISTLELYRGENWKRARAAAQATNVELWAISAGLGLRHSDDQATSYESTFNNSPFSSKKLWELLINNPPLKGRTSSIARLMMQHREDTIVLAASPVYVSAVEDDVINGLEFFDGELIIVTSKGYAGQLKGFVHQSHASLMSELNSNMTNLNISLACRLIKRMVSGL